MKYCGICNMKNTPFQSKFSYDTFHLCLIFQKIFLDIFYNHVTDLLSIIINFCQLLYLYCKKIDFGLEYLKITFSYKKLC